MKWLKVLGVIILVAGLLVGIMAAIGGRLPIDHEVTRVGRYAAPPDTVWNTITNFAAAPTWRDDVDRVERLPDRNGHPVWVEWGMRGPLAFEVVEFQAPRRMVTRVADEMLPFGGSWTFEVRAARGGGSTLSVTEHGEIYNSLFRFLGRYVIGHHVTVETYLRALGRKLGGGEVLSEPG